jgi:hypothetical protein
MQKSFITLLLLAFSISAIAQKKQYGYLSIRGGPSFKDGAIKGIASVSVGVSNNNIFGIGMSLGYINYNKPYIPLMADISFFGKPGKVTPVIIGQAGYGIYNNTTALSVGRGGFVGAINAGIAFPVKGKNKIIFTAGYYSYNFITYTTIYSTSKKVSTRENRIAATIGFKI